MKHIIKWSGIFVGLLVFIFFTTFVGFYTDYLWFDALGFSQIFMISLLSKIKLFFVIAIAFFLFVIINLWISGKLSKNQKAYNQKAHSQEHKTFYTFRLKLIITTILSIMVGLTASNSWFKILQYYNQTSFNITDPIFMKDVSFYVFSLPFFRFVLAYIIAAVIITGIMVLIDYLKDNIKDYFRPKQRIIGEEAGSAYIPNSNGNPTADNGKSAADNLLRANKKKHEPVYDITKLFSNAATAHLGVLASLLFILLAVWHYFARFSIMYSEQGIVVGAGYSDVVVYLPMIKILMALAIFTAVLILVYAFYISTHKRLKKRHILAYGLILYFIFGFIGPTVIPNLVQSLKVSPNEINLEAPYIQNNIKFTRMAYGLSDVEERNFDVNTVSDSATDSVGSSSYVNDVSGASVSKGITPEILEEAKETIDNVRILDWRPLIQTYKQTQEIRLYYDLSGIDIDRYDIDGKYTEVMLAPRELDQKQITDNAKTWVNLHMVYTHGFGVVMSPVNEVTKQGLPKYLIQDIPPVYTVEEPNLKIDRPQIYYGEKDNDFVLVNTKTNEFDYPKGNTNEYINYDGKGGIVLDSFMKKLAMAIRFGDIKILLSSDFTDKSKIMFNRHIVTRISKLTPFLRLDNDPYLVINEGRLYWIQDAYTTTNNYPYSAKYGTLFNNINYIRNSVKIVVDAYDGTVTYYMMGSDVNVNKNDKNLIVDPIMSTYAKIFPDQFKKFDEMPEGLKSHIRYPEDLFKVQSQIYSTYHMDDIKVFYNKEDAWQIPTEIYGVGQQVMVEPYYIIMKLPEEEKAEFVLMTSFAPIKKDNMVAWMAARNDGDEYGKLLLYKFQKDKLIYGPLQIEAKIDQDSEISQQLTLWSQQGSRVTRGNLLVIPIKNSILYIEPLYIQAETGQLPELKRVLVSDGDRVVMEENLAMALEVLFGKSKLSKTKSDYDSYGKIDTGADSICGAGNIGSAGSTCGADNTYNKNSVDEDFKDSLLEKSDAELIRQAQQYYDLIDESMKQGDWSGIGDNLDKLGSVLDSLKLKNQ
ncbi:MAG: UPF0182 family protein [Candidatus Woesearchaeota archaeon]